MTKAAKRRKKEEEEEFILPDFDEAAYMEKEVTVAKFSFALIAFALVFSFVLFGMSLAGLWAVGLLLGLAVTLLLPRVLDVVFKVLAKILPWLRIDFSKFERREWVAHRGAFFFSWLAFWILLLNAPVVDVTNPVIAGVTAFAGASPVVIREGAGVRTDVTLSPGNDTWINATVFDNVGIQTVTLTVEGSTVTASDVQGPVYKFRVPLSDGAHDVIISATDVRGLPAKDFAFQVNLTLPPP